MNKDTGNPAKEAALGCVAAALVLCACGCAVAKLPVGIVDLTLGTNMSGVNTPPSTTWKANSSATSNHISKVAIYVENLSGSEKNAATANLERPVEDEFIGSLLQKGYKVAARSDADRLKVEVDFQRGGRTKQQGLPDNRVSEFGKMLNVPVVLIVSIREATARVQNDGSGQYFTASCTISARLVSVEQGEQLGISSYTSYTSVNDRNQVLPAVLAAAKVVAVSLPQNK